MLEIILNKYTIRDITRNTCSRDFDTVVNELRLQKDREWVHIYSKGKYIYIKFTDYTKFDMTKLASFKDKKNGLYENLTKILEEGYDLQTIYNTVKVSILKIKLKNKCNVNRKYLIYLGKGNFEIKATELAFALLPRKYEISAESSFLASYIAEVLHNIVSHNYLSKPVKLVIE